MEKTALDMSGGGGIGLEFGDFFRAVSSKGKSWKNDAGILLKRIEFHYLGYLNPFTFCTFSFVYKDMFSHKNLFWKIYGEGCK